MNSLQKLELLSLVSRLARELNNHIGVEDKTLSEFILSLHDRAVNQVGLEDPDHSDVLKVFKQNLQEEGAEFPEELVDKMNEIIFQLHPSYKSLKKKASSVPEQPGTDKRATVAPKTNGLSGLAIKDSFSMDNKDYSRRIKEEQSKNKGTDILDGEMNRMFSDTNAEKPEPEPELRRGRPQRRDSSSRSYSRSPDRSRTEYRGRSPPWKSNSKPLSRSETKSDPAVGDICEARITNITDFGAFANIEGYNHINERGRWRPRSGLIHISELASHRVEHPSEVVQRGDVVTVKIVKIENGKIGLSIKALHEASRHDDERDYDSRSNNSEIRSENTKTKTKPKPKKRLTSPERWELRQLIASGAISATDYPELQENYIGSTNSDADEDDEQENEFEMEEEVDIELKEEEPPFLAGQTKQSLELSPIRVVKAPDGSLNRAAMNGATLAHERRETRQQQAKGKADKERADSNVIKRLEQDPLAAFDGDAAESTNESLSSAVKTNPITWRKGEQKTFGKRSDMPIDLQRKSLPVYQLRKQLLQAVQDNQILIVVGDTGSGKTTQITQYLYEEGFAGRNQKIGCTQPRRVAAVSVAKRVAEEVGAKLGDEVGYTIRFEDVTSPRTKIKYMTDGMLQREALVDPDMSQYSVLMLDEAHERTISTDVLFALLKKAAKRRPDLKLLITSATLDAEKFSKYFWDCPVLYIPGRTFPVDIEYVKEPELDYLDAALKTVVEIHLSEPAGDILVFLTGQEEIDTSCEVLEEKMKTLKSTLGEDEVADMLVLPVYSALPSEMQSRIFDPAPPNSRKVILATNIAETSLTIDGIFYVVDPGFVKINAYDSKLGMDSLIISPISQAQANQRAGRAGRTGPGKCFRLYTQSAFENEMLPNTVPEIQRQNLSHTILMLKAMGINDLLHFDFMDPPPTNTMLTALEDLYQLSALDDEGLLTRLGRKMADFPMEPAMAKVLISSVDQSCSEEVLTIVAMLSVQSVFYRPKDKKERADQKKAKFNDPSGDHLTLMNVYNGWVRSGYSKIWCSDNFIQERSMKRASEVRKQLVSIIHQRYKGRLETCGMNTDIVRKVLCSGYFRNSARKDPQEGYKTLVESTPVFMHPSSSLLFKPAEYVIYQTLLLTTKEYMHCVTTINPKWLVEAAPHFFKVAGKDGELSQRQKNVKIQPLFNRYSTDANDWRLSAQKKLIRQAQTASFS